MAKQTIGEFLAVLRKARGMTQEEAAEKLQVSSKTVSSWENDRTYPDILLLPAIAELYGVSVDELVRGERNTHDECAEQTKEINETALNKMRRNKLVRYEQKRSVLTVTAIIGLILSPIGIAFQVDWVAILFIIIGLFTSLLCTLLLLHHTKSYLASEGIAFTEDITPENGQFYLSVNHEMIVRIKHILFLPFLLIFFCVRLSGTACILITLVMLFGLSLWQRHIVVKHGTEKQIECEINNLKIIVGFAVLTIIAAGIAGFAVPVNSITFFVKSITFFVIEAILGFILRKRNCFAPIQDTL